MRVSETWRDIVGHQHYQVSLFGRVRVLVRSKMMKNKVIRAYPAKFLAPIKHSHGYLKVCLPDRKKHYIHRLVALAFVLNPDKYTEVNHKDLNKKNNFADNLEWVSRGQNVRHAHTSGAYDKARLSWRESFSGAGSVNAKLTEKLVEQARLKRRQGMTYVELAAMFGVSRDAITKAVLGKSWKKVDGAVRQRLRKNISG